MSWEPHEPKSGFHIPIKRCEVVIHFTDGTSITEPFNMIVQGGTERRIAYIEVDGVRYVPARRRDWDCSTYMD